ncbi:MAG: hypothetical protein ABI789_05580, partial [Usitatibacter sp.]
MKETPNPGLETYRHRVNVKTLLGAAALALAALALAAAAQQAPAPRPAVTEIAVAELSPEAREV